MIEYNQNLNFKSQFKYFKSKCPPPDISHIIDPFAESAPFTAVNVWNPKIDFSGTKFRELGMQPLENWKVVEYNGISGLFIVKDILTPDGELFWARKCLFEYCLPPNINNITALEPEFSEKSNPRALHTNLRWSAQGYIYDWTNKVYREKDRSTFCPMLYEMARFIVSATVRYDNYTPDAAIINHYFQNSVLNGHVDRSEWTMNPPLLSFSLGQSCIFLAGGLTLDDPPIPILLRNGYIMIMKDHHRKIYHAVPRILHDFSVQPCANLDENVQSTVDYLNKNRINMTVRQVREYKE